MSQIQSPDSAELSPEEKRRLDQTLLALAEYIFTPEGEQLVERLISIVKQIESRKREVILSPQETVALCFIRNELRQKRSPTVRAVAKALKVKSSRTGFLILAGLIEKKMLRREGRLLIVEG